METSMPLAANPVVSVLSSLSWNAARRMLNAAPAARGRLPKRRARRHPTHAIAVVRLRRERGEMEERWRR